MQNLNKLSFYSWNIDNGAGFAPDKKHSKNMKILFPEYIIQKRIDTVIKFIKKSNTDIILIQEAITNMNGFNTVEYIRKAFKDTYFIRVTPYNPFSELNSKHGHIDFVEYMTLVKKNIGLSIENVTLKQEREDTESKYVHYMTFDEMPYDVQKDKRKTFHRQLKCLGEEIYRVIQITEVKYKNKSFYLLNTHMDIPKRSRYTQYKILKNLLLKYVKENKQFIVSGDFNAMHETIEEKRMGIHSLSNNNWKRCNNFTDNTFKCNPYDLLFYRTWFLFPKAYKNFCNAETKEDMLKYYNMMVQMIQSNKYEINTIEELKNIDADINLKEIAMKSIKHKSDANWPNMVSVLDTIYTNFAFENYKLHNNLKGTSDHFPLSIDLLV